MRDAGDELPQRRELFRLGEAPAQLLALRLEFGLRRQIAGDDDAAHALAVGVEEVQRNFQAYGMLDDRVEFLKGWFKDTLPVAPIKSIAIMRLDGDYYESTRDALINLYDKLSVGGYVIIDDYGEDSWTYCRKAVDEFRDHRGITGPMIKVDSKCYYWQRTN